MAAVTIARTLAVNINCFQAVVFPSASSVAPMNLAIQSTDTVSHLIKDSEENQPDTLLLIFSSVAARLLILYSLINDVPHQMICWINQLTL
jgi:fucose permease